MDSGQEISHPFSEKALMSKSVFEAAGCHLCRRGAGVSRSQSEEKVIRAGEQQG